MAVQNRRHGWVFPQSRKLRPRTFCKMIKMSQANSHKQPQVPCTVHGAMAGKRLVSWAWRWAKSGTWGMNGDDRSWLLHLIASTVIARNGYNYIIVASIGVLPGLPWKIMRHSCLPFLYRFVWSHLIQCHTNLLSECLQRHLRWDQS